MRIEEDALQLSSVLASQPLQQRERIESLLSEITSLAIRSRQRVAGSGVVVSYSHMNESDAVVTPKEIRELLEAFA